jgi:hypothetical protein
VRAKLALDDSAELDVVATAVRKSMHAKDYHISAATIRSMRHKYVDVEDRRDDYWPFCNGRPPGTGMRRR